MTRDVERGQHRPDDTVVFFRCGEPVSLPQRADLHLSDKGEMP
jgi:hypothetical protein